MSLSVLTATAAYGASAAEPGAASKPERSYTGIVSSVSPAERVLDVRGFWRSRRFNLGDTCTYALLDKDPGAVQDLRPGQKVTVRYQDARGVLVADRVRQLPMREEGQVKAIDPATHTLTVHHGAITRTFAIADNCSVMLRGDKTGALTDIRPGHLVTVTYETPNRTATAREIAQTSATFTGSLTALDLNNRTVKAKAAFGAKKFNLADGCVFMLNGRPDGQMRDLRPGEKLTFTYDAVNGVNIVNRIASAEELAPAMTAESNTR